MMHRIPFTVSVLLLNQLNNVQSFTAPSSSIIFRFEARQGQDATHKRFFDSVNKYQCTDTRNLDVSQIRNHSTERRSTAASLALDEKVERESFNPGPGITFGSSGLKLNIFGMIYGSIAIITSSLWYSITLLLQFFYFITRNKFDPNRRLPVMTAHTWGMFLLLVTRSDPIVTGRENMDEYYNSQSNKKSQKPVMFVGNHVSWMDIPFMSYAIGWRNYKIIAKKELLKIPILSRCLSASQHILLDRTNRRSQFETYKQGVNWLERGVNLVTFPEGTRSRDGRLGEFKKGPIKMAQKVGVPIVPVSITYAHKIQPLEYVWPVRPGRSIPASMHIGKPISTEGKSEEELFEEVKAALAEKLPMSQKPLKETDINKL